VNGYPGPGEYRSSTLRGLAASAAFIAVMAAAIIIWPHSHFAGLVTGGADLGVFVRSCRAGARRARERWPS
jgi:hypothetical protein